MAELDWPAGLPPDLVAELEDEEERYIFALDNALMAHLRSLTGDRLTPEFEESLHPRAHGRFIEKGETPLTPALYRLVNNWPSFGHKDQRPGVKGYSGQDASFEINEALRQHTEQHAHPQLRRVIGQLTEEIEASSSDESMSMYRGVHGPNAVDSLQDGAAIKDYGFMSGTTVEKHARDFAGVNSENPVTGAIVKISIPPGARALTVQNSDEHEIILQRGTTVRVKSTVMVGRVKYVTAVVEAQEQFRMSFNRAPLRFSWDDSQFVVVDYPHDALEEFNDEENFEEAKHPRDPAGKFAKKFVEEIAGAFSIPGWQASGSQEKHIKRVAALLGKKAGASHGYRWGVNNLIKEHNHYQLNSSVAALNMKVAESFFVQGTKMKLEAEGPSDPKLVKSAQLLNKAHAMGYDGPSSVAPSAVEATLQQAAAPQSFIETDPGVGSITSSKPQWTKVGSQQGSNYGGFYTDQDGKHWYVKIPKSEDQIDSDLFANYLYKIAGLDVPMQIKTTLEGKPAIASLILPGGGKTFGDLKGDARASAIQKLRVGFAMDAWLANRDVIGLGGDNIVMVGATPYRVDQGACLKYRAQGELKDEFGAVPKELGSMRSPDINKDSAEVFAGMDQQQVISSINLLNTFNDDFIRTAAATFNQKEVGEILIERKSALLAVQKVQKKMEEPAEPDYPTLTAEQEKKAKKSTPYPTSGFAEVEKVIEQFNKQYAGKEITDPKLLAKKAFEFEKMVGEVGTLKVKLSAQITAQNKAKAEEELKKQAEAYGLNNPEAKKHYEALGSMVSGGQSAKNFLDTAAQKLKYANLPNMTPADAALVGAYSCSYYGEVNRQLRDRACSAEQYKFAVRLNKALDKMPSFVGTVYRKASMPASVAAKYVPGKIVVEDAFTSCSKKEGVWSGDYHYQIKTRAGGAAKDIEKLSHHGSSESEVLYKAGTAFRVISKHGSAIIMEELEDEDD